MNFKPRMVRKKVGKQRLDKYYHLAKEHGYRARSAYKLIQLDQKFNVLRQATSVLDLCAAPGGWLQVASNLLPMDSIILGIDISPIRPLHKVTTIKGDITSPSILQDIQKYQSEFDVVLHDGAPNVGTEWEQDAYLQNVLVLSALKIASQVLTNKGTFITKVFRSRNYSSLIWVFEKLFGNVASTKPLSSRDESAEIFVCCREFKKDFIDERFFEAEHVFKDQTEKKCGGVLSFEEFINERELSILLKTHARVDILGYEQFFDEDLKIMLGDLKLVNVNDFKKIVRKRNQLVRNTLSSEDQNFSKVKALIHLEEKFEVDDDSDWKVQTIESEIKRKKRKEKRIFEGEKIRQAKNKIYDLPSDEFFEDKLFTENFFEEGDENEINKPSNDNRGEETNNSSSEEICNKMAENCADDSEDSESFEINDKDIPTLVKIKTDPVNFALSTVDRNIRGEENLPDWYLAEEEEFNARMVESSSEETKTPKKQLEALTRRKKKAKRVTEKKLENEEDEDENEKGRVMRNAFKKTKMKPLLVHPRNGKIVIPKTGRKIKLVDRRMKKELRAEKRRKKKSNKK